MVVLTVHMLSGSKMKVHRITGILLQIVMRRRVSEIVPGWRQRIPLICSAHRCDTIAGTRSLFSKFCQIWCLLSLLSHPPWLWAFSQRSPLGLLLPQGPSALFCNFYFLVKELWMARGGTEGSRGWGLGGHQGVLELRGGSTELHFVLHLENTGFYKKKRGKSIPMLGGFGSKL